MLKQPQLFSQLPIATRETKIHPLEPIVTHPKRLFLNYCRQQVYRDIKKQQQQQHSETDF